MAQSKQHMNNLHSGTHILFKPSTKQNL